MKPGYEPKTLEASLVHLNEECAEVIKAVSKIQRFGLHNINPDSPQDLSIRWTNKNALFSEMEDLERAIARVRTMVPHGE